MIVSTIIPALFSLSSIIVLAFVKSEGKAVTRKPSDNGRISNESTALLSGQTDSLEGSLRNRVVSSLWLSGWSPHFTTVTRPYLAFTL